MLKGFAERLTYDDCSSMKANHTTLNPESYVSVYTLTIKTATHRYRTTLEVGAPNLLNLQLTLNLM
jgi:hypothetical protein